MTSEPTRLSACIISFNEEDRIEACVASLENTMACGFGVCLGCAAPLAAGGFALVCRDGPMFDASEIAWDGLP